MNRVIRIVAVAAALALALPAAAQPPARQVSVGLGVGLSTSEAPLLRAGVAGGVIAPQLYVPINVGPNLRIEPQFGFLTFHDDANGDDISYTSVGTGVFFLMPLGGNVGLYVGPRLVFSFFDQEQVDDVGVVTKTEATDVLVAAALGGELWVHPRFSVGAEGQLGYTSLGDVDQTVAGVTTTGPGGSSWATQGILFVRVYLF